jgi:transposase InsO family protein
MSRKRFPKEAAAVNEPMECIVSDVCGPIQVESLGRKRYFVSFIDIFSGYCKLFFIREKSEVAGITIEYMEYLKTQTGKKVKKLRTDRGTEYLNERLQSYLRKEGINFECTVGYAPEQNGIAERKNRTLMEATRSMLAESGLGKSLWAEAADTANFVFNRMVDGKTKESPYEKMFGKKPKLPELHEFGADVYSMVPYQKRRKLDDKALKMKFVGYSETSKGYRLVDRNYKIHTSREVHFVHTKEQFRNPQRKETRCEYYEIYLDGDDEEMENHEQVDQVVAENMENNEEVIINDANDEEEFFDAEQNLIEPMDAGEEVMQVQEEQEALEPPQEVRRSARGNIGILPNRYNEYQMYSAKAEEKFEPRTYTEAMNHEESKQWLEAMQKELEAIKENDTWIMADLPKGRKAIGSKWVYKIKKDENGKSIFKARLVAQGFTQRSGIDYDEVFAPVARDTTFRLLLSVAGMKNYTVCQYDIKTAFLNGKLDEEIYLEQPPGFKEGNQVYRLRKCLYGLKQAAHVWNQTLHESLIKNGCEQNETDKCLYKKEKHGKICFIIIHVDDMLTATDDQNLSLELMKNIGMDFQIKHLGRVKSYLGIEVENLDGEYHIWQPDHIDKIVKEMNLADGKDSKFPLDTGYYKLDGEELPSNEEYRKMIGMLLYLSTKTRPDIAASVSILSQKVSKPRDCDWNEVKRITRYLKATREMKLRLNKRGMDNDLQVFSDASWAEDRTDRKSNSGYLCKVNGGTVSWSCKKQGLVTLSSMESEYVALTEACKEVQWLTTVARAFPIIMPITVVINTDSQSCIEAIKNQKFSYRTKHIDTRHHYIREQVNVGKVKLQYCNTENNVADMMTKPLGSTKLTKHREEAGLIQQGGDMKNSKIEGVC